VIREALLEYEGEEHGYVLDGSRCRYTSVHAGKTKGLNARAWYEFDRLGYREAEKSIIQFSEKCYSESQRGEDRLRN
jgi:hypothetical protein